MAEEEGSEGGDEDRMILVDDNLEDGEEQPLPPDTSPECGVMYLAAAVAAIGGLLFGYDVGIVNSAKGEVTKEMSLSCWQEELVVSVMAVGALAASLVAGPLLNRVGRRTTIQLTALGFTVGAVVMAVAGNLSVLLFGRFVVGFAVSLSAMAECLYISEIATPTTRGRLVSFNELGITLGFLLAFLSGFSLVNTAGGWRVMFGLSGVLAVVQGVAMCGLPRTPHYLLLTKREKEAGQVLRRLRGSAGNKQELANIRLSCQEVADSSCGQLLSGTDNMRGRMAVGLGLVVLQQLTGQPNILLYSTDIFQAVGFCTDMSSALASVILGLVKVATTVVSLLLVDRLGRRTLLLFGTTVMTASLAVLVVFASYQLSLGDDTPQHQTCSSHGLDNLTTNRQPDNLTSTTVLHNVLPDNLTSSNLLHNVLPDNLTTTTFSNLTSVSLSDNHPACGSSPLPPLLPYIAFTSLLLYVSAFSLSFGPVTWVILGEIFPLSLKGHAMSLSQAVNWCFNVLVSSTFLDVVRVFSLPAVFSFYLLMSVLAVVFIYLAVPETKNKSLEQISKELKNVNTAARARDHLSCVPCLKNLVPGVAARTYSSRFSLLDTNSDGRPESPSSFAELEQ